MNRASRDLSRPRRPSFIQLVIAVCIDVVRGHGEFPLKFQFSAVFERIPVSVTDDPERPVHFQCTSTFAVHRKGGDRPARRVKDISLVREDEQSNFCNRFIPKRIHLPHRGRHAAEGLSEYKRSICLPRILVYLLRGILCRNEQPKFLFPKASAATACLHIHRSRQRRTAVCCAPCLPVFRMRLFREKRRLPAGLCLCHHSASPPFSSLCGNRLTANRSGGTGSVSVNSRHF